MVDNGTGSQSSAVTLSNLPTNRTLSTSASISYETASSGSVYCRLDSYVPIACPNPFVLGTTAEQALSAGTHTVDYYVDSGSGFDLSNPTSSYSWVVEAAATTPTTTAPAETIPAVTTPVATAPAVTTPAATTPSTAQIPTLGSISAAQSFSAMNGYVQRLGGSSSLSATPESSGITASGSIAGSTMRFGKIADPLNPARQVLRFAGAASDPLTYGHSRVEAGFSTGTASIVPDTTYWIACELNIPASRLTNGGSGNVMQVHQSDSAVDVFGPFALVVYNPGGVSVVYRYASNPSSPQGSVLWSDTKYPTDTWQKWVFKFRTNYSGANGSFLQAWQNGVKRVDYSGPIGINTPGYNDYVKFGWDDWSGQGGGAGTYNLVRSCHLVKDAGYSLDQVSALLN